MEELIHIIFINKCCSKGMNYLRELKQFLTTIKKPFYVTLYSASHQNSKEMLNKEDWCNLGKEPIMIIDNIHYKAREWSKFAETVSTNSNFLTDIEKKVINGNGNCEECD